MLKDPRTSENVTVRQLLALPLLSQATLLAGDAGVDLSVLDVQIAPQGTAVFLIQTGASVVIDGSRVRTDTYFLDLVLRWASEASASMVVVTNPGLDIGLAPRRLANRLGIPLVETDLDTFIVVDSLREIITEPDRVLAALIVDAVTALSRVNPREGASGMLRVVDSILDATTALVGLEGRTVLGLEIDPPLVAKDRIPVYTIQSLGQTARAIQPVVLAINEAPSFWLVAERDSPTASWRRGAESILKIASQFLVATLLSDRLAQERDARVRLGALNAVIASDGTEPSVLRQIGVLGWKVEGWCSAVHVQSIGSGNELLVLARTDELKTALSRNGIDGAIIERADGWTLWGFSDREPTAGQRSKLIAGVRRALLTIAAEHEDMKVAAGIGRPYFGLAGLRRSLAEAHEAATIAQTGGDRVAVQHIDELGVQQILFGWYSSKEFAEYARTLLKPILDADAHGVLMETLESYLDSQSSPTLTAESLGLHRNTVMNRLTRVQDLLVADLTDPDQRLAVQLACRIIRLDSF